MHTIGLRRMLAAATLALFGGATLFAGAAAAQAADGNINFDARGSITLHKLEQPDALGEAASGAEQDTSGMTPISGVEFTATPVTGTKDGTDLTNTPSGLQDPANWDVIESLTAADVTLDTGKQVVSTVTDQQGVTSFTDLPVGLYVVAETGTPDGVIAADPFLVSIPTSVSGEWTYDLHVYPKNGISGVEKTLDADSDASAFGAGDELAWNVAGTVPALPASADGKRMSYDKIEYVDELDMRLAFIAIRDAQAGGAALAEGTDYTVTQDGQRIVLTLTEAGREKFGAEKTSITYQVVTSVVSEEKSPVGDGAISNQVSQHLSTNKQDTDIVTESGGPVTYWGDIYVKKVDGDNQNALAGAEFQVFRTQADAKTQSDPIAVNGVTTFTTGDDGVVRIVALNAGADNARTLWLVETKSPAGYVAAKEPIQVEVTAGTATEFDVTVSNTKQESFDLPLTGSVGTVLLAVTAAVLVGAGVAVGAWNRRRASHR